MFGGAIVMILGALAVGSGYGWGTWKTVFTQGPSRAAAFGGTLVALLVLVAGLVLATVGVDLAMAASSPRSRRGRPPCRTSATLATSLGGGVLILGMWAAAGVLLGVLARGPALAVGLGLVWALVVENLLRGVADALPADRGASPTGCRARRPARWPARSAPRRSPTAAPRACCDALSGAGATAWTVGYLVVCVAVSLALVDPARPALRRGRRPPPRRGSARPQGTSAAPGGRSARG